MINDQRNEEDKGNNENTRVYPKVSGLSRWGNTICLQQ